jgi:hypothetical protein
MPNRVESEIGLAGNTKIYEGEGKRNWVELNKFMGLKKLRI